MTDAQQPAEQMHATAQQDAFITRGDKATPPITGYRDLSPSEIELINRIKEHEARTADLLHLVRNTVPPQSEQSRQAAIARSDFEGAFMRLVRAVANPVSPWR
jgi:hypothetical protein